MASAGYQSWVDADELAQKLARSLLKVWDARGLTDRVLGDRTGKRLARALVEVHGKDDAAAWAQRLQSWSAAAVTELRG